MTMRSFFGIPAHPLLVHLPAVLLPLAAVGVLLMVIKPVWHLRYRWAVLVIGAIGTVGAILAVGAGESLEEKITAKEGQAAASGWEDHAEAGETARLFAILFLIVLVAYILVPWFVARKRSSDASATTSLPRWVAIGLTVLVLAGSIGTVVTVTLAGHSGAKAVWCETNTPPNCASGG